MKKLKLQVKILSLFLSINLVGTTTQFIPPRNTELLAPTTALKGEVYFPHFQLVHQVPATTPDESRNSWREQVLVGAKELDLTFDPVRFLALHDNQTESGEVDWVKVSSRLVGISLIYLNMILGPYLLGQVLLPHLNFPIAFLMYLGLLVSVRLFNEWTHNFYNLIATYGKLGLLSLNLPNLGEEGRVALSGAGLKPHFGAGKAIKLASKIEKKLGDPKKAKDKEKTRGEGKDKFRIYLGKSRNHTKWGIDERDLPKLAGYYKVTIQKVVVREGELPTLGEEGRVALSLGGLKPHFGKSKAIKLASKIEKELGNPKKAKEKEKTRGKGKARFRVYLGKSGNHTKWGIDERDLPKLAGYSGVTIQKVVVREGELPNLGEEGRVALSGPGLTPHFGAGKAIKLASKIEKKLGDPKKAKEKEKTRGKGKARFRVYLGKSGPATKWGINETDLPRLASYFGVLELPTLGEEGRVALSGPGLEPHFGAGKAIKLASKIEKELGDPNKVKKKEKTRGKGKARFRVYLGKSRTHTKWGINETDLPKLASYFGAVVQEGELPNLGEEGRVALSKGGLKPHFGAGKAIELVSKIEKELGETKDEVVQVIKDLVELKLDIFH